MEIEEFKAKLKLAKYSLIDTALYDIKVSSKDNNTKKIYSKGVCSNCKREDNKEVVVTFYKPHNLTIFEAGLLYALYCLNKKPRDYAGYDNCIAGMEFIENIKSIG